MYIYPGSVFPLKVAKKPEYHIKIPESYIKTVQYHTNHSIYLVSCPVSLSNKAKGERESGIYLLKDGGGTLPRIVHMYMKLNTRLTVNKINLLSH